MDINAEKSRGLSALCNQVMLRLRETTNCLYMETHSKFSTTQSFKKQLSRSRFNMCVLTTSSPQLTFLNSGDSTDSKHCISWTTTFTQLEPLTNLTAINIEKNEVSQTCMMRTFIVYRFPNVTLINEKIVTDTDKQRARQ
jgi:hypothetical protein